MTQRILTIFALFLLIGSQQVFAEGDAESADQFLSKQSEQEKESKNTELSEVDASIAAAKAELEDEAVLAKKVELAKKMHAIRPTREQVDAAVDRAAMSIPQFQRAAFIASMRSVLNYNAIERISIDSMVETYTLKELEAMVAYYSTPEAISASKKVGRWAQAVQPEIIHMIDKAMLRVRTGQ